MFLKGERTFVVRDMGGFVVHINMPGWLKPRPVDHGLGPLAMVVESFLDPGRLIAMHEHRNDEIISWVPEGVMLHDDRAAGRLVTDRDHLMVMNSGRGFWHSEETLPSDPPLRMLQIMVRPSALDLEPMIQHGPLPPALPNTWRHLVGPPDGGAPFHVRNALDFYDIRLDAGACVDCVAMPGRDVYFYVFSGTIVVEGQAFGEGEQGLLLSERILPIVAKARALLVAFLVDPAAPVTRKGTVGDHRNIPSAIFMRIYLKWRHLRRGWCRAIGL
jgi:redox-sensitive bicupin YhaK (pirin superfamily)